MVTMNPRSLFCLAVCVLTPACLDMTNSFPRCPDDSVAGCGSGGTNGGATGGDSGTGATNGGGHDPTAPIRIASGDHHTCVVLNSGALKCWGDNMSGQLGNGQSGAGTDTGSPVTVSGIGTSAKAVAAGVNVTCVLLKSGALKCWGAGGLGALGNGVTYAQEDTPVNVIGIDGVAASAVAISTGGGHTCAALDSGEAKCWGANYSGELGNGVTSSTGENTPVAVDGIDGVLVTAVSIAAGDDHSCALLDTGAMQCWGSNHDGQLGDGTSGGEDQPSPIAVLGIDGSTHSAVAVAADDDCTCAVLDTGALWCWGLGVGTATPTQVQGIDGTGASALQVAVGLSHRCVVLTNGAVKCWGSDDSGELGNGAGDTPKTNPDPVVGIDGSAASALQVATGDDFSCALLDTGAVRCWGYNYNGELGEGTACECSDNHRHTPVTVVNIP